MQVKLNKNISDKKGNIFAKGSVVEFMTKVSKEGLVQTMPVDAVDEQGLPYIQAGMNTIYELEVTASDYTQLENQVELKKMSFNYPNSYFEMDEDDTITASLEDLYAEKDYKLNADGVVTKKAEMDKTEEMDKEEMMKEEEMDKKEGYGEKTSMKKESAEENMLVGDSDKITTDFDASVDGSDNPIDESMRNDIANPDEKEKPFDAMGGENAINASLKKLQDLKKLLSKEQNYLTKSNEDTSIDYNPAIEGSGMIDKSTYSADEKEMQWDDEYLGKVK